MDCKYCGCGETVKNGQVGGKQRYLCKVCKRTFRHGDERVKYSGERKIEAIKWYLEGSGIRSIARQMGVSATLVLKWLRKGGALLRERTHNLHQF